MPRKCSADDFEVRVSTIPGAGRGLFAKTRIDLEDTLGYYTGEIITEAELLSGRYSGSDYLLWISKNWIIVGEGAKANYTRFINHSEEPNAYLVVSTRWKTARLECVRPIAPEEEIFFSYGDQFWF